MSVASSMVNRTFSRDSIPDVRSEVEKYILSRFERVNDWVPAVSVVPEIVMVSDDAGTEIFAPSVVSKVR